MAASEIQKRNAKQHLSRLIKGYRKEYEMPAVGAGLVIGDELVVSHVTGVRKFGTNHQTLHDDLFQLGSITKPMTGYLAARLIDKGNVLAWGLTLGWVYPEIINKLEDLPWINHYRDTTVTDLMTHASGLDTLPRNATEAALGVVDNPPGSTPRENLIKKRKLYTELALQDQPYAGWKAVGGCTLVKYSTGCVLVASMIEKVLGVTWDQLMKEHVFEPLGITHYAFGPMSSETSVTNTWQHRIENDQVNSVVHPNVDKHIAWVNSPAGAVGLSIGDFGKWVAAVLTNSNGFLTNTTWTEYVSKVAGCDNTRGGWFVRWDGRLSHNGSNGWSRADCILDINKGIGGFACTNIDNEDVGRSIYELCLELTAMGEAWDAVGFLHQAVDFYRVNVSDHSVRDNIGIHDPQLVSDGLFRTSWDSKFNTPTFTARLDRPRMLKGVILCQAVEPRIQSFDIETKSGDQGATPQTLNWAALQQQTTHSANGLVIRTLFDAPMRVKSLQITVNAASDKPVISGLLVLEYAWAEAVELDIAKDGRLWVVDTNDRVLNAVDPAEEPFIVLKQPYGMHGSLVRTSVSFYSLDLQNLVWKGTSSGLAKVTGAGFVPCKRIAVDKVKDTVWAIDLQGGIRHYDGSKWVEHPGKGQGKDICVRDGTPYIVSMDDFIYHGTSAGWQKLPGSSPKMQRIAVDEESGKLWGISTGHVILSYNAAADTWATHPGGGLGKAIAVHKGIPYIIGMDGTIWKSIGGDGWEKLNVLMDKPVVVS